MPVHKAPSPQSRPRKGLIRQALTEFGITVAFGGAILGAGYHTMQQEAQKLDALAARGFVPEGEGQKGLARYHAEGRAQRDAYAHIDILRRKPGFDIGDYFKEGQSDSAMAALDCTFEEAHYGRDFGNLMNVISHNWADHDKNEKIRECFWQAQSPADFLSLEDRMYRNVLGRLARDPYVRSRVETWRTSKQYASASQAEAQYRMKRELVQYLADNIRAEFGLPPVPVVVDNHWPNGSRMADNIGGVFNSHMGEIGLIILNPTSFIGFDRSFKDMFSNLLIEEVKHSIDYHIGMLAVSGVYPKTHPFYYHGLMVSIGKQYNSSVGDPAKETAEEKKRRWYNYEHCFVERTAKALEKKVPKYFFNSYNANRPRVMPGTGWLGRAQNAAYRLGQVSVGYGPAAVPVPIPAM